MVSKFIIASTKHSTLSRFGEKMTSFLHKHMFDEDYLKKHLYFSLNKIDSCTLINQWVCVFLHRVVSQKNVLVKVFEMLACSMNHNLETMLFWFSLDSNLDISSILNPLLKSITSISNSLK